jgi:hypothetical protein
MSTITTRIAGLALAAGAAAGMVAATSASAFAVSPSTVTIQAEGTDLSGTVSSSNPSCVDGRNVVVFKQVGARGGGNDIRFASDTADSDGSWNTGNTGTEGRFYAKVKKTATCSRDLSPTVRAVR